MGAKSEELAKQFEAKSRDALATLGKLSEADWKKVTEAEKWSVGVTAHHLASVLEAVSGMIKAVVAKQAPGDLSMELIDDMNARHAKDFAACTRAETIELHRKGSATAAATIRGLSDADLATGGTVLKGLPPMTAEQLIAGGLLAHIDDHYGSIRRTVGH
jgi:DinB superfamily